MQSLQKPVKFKLILYKMTVYICIKGPRKAMQLYEMSKY